MRVLAQLTNQPDWVQIASLRQVGSSGKGQTQQANELFERWQQIEKLTCPNQPSHEQEVKKILDQIARQSATPMGIQAAFALRKQLISIPCFDPTNRKSGANPQTTTLLSASCMILQGLIAKTSQQLLLEPKPLLKAISVLELVESMVQTPSLPHLQDHLYLLSDELREGLGSELYMTAWKQLYQPPKHNEQPTKNPPSKISSPKPPDPTYLQNSKKEEGKQENDSGSVLSFVHWISGLPVLKQKSSFHDIHIIQNKNQSLTVVWIYGDQVYESQWNGINWSLAKRLSTLSSGPVKQLRVLQTEKGALVAFTQEQTNVKEEKNKKNPINHEDSALSITIFGTFWNGFQWGAVQKISIPAQELKDFELVESKGMGVILFRSVLPGPHAREQLAVSLWKDTWSPIQMISSPNDGHIVGKPLFLSPLQTPLLLWIQQKEGYPTTCLFTASLQDGVWSKPIILSMPNLGNVPLDEDSIKAEMTPAGEVILVWKQFSQNHMFSPIDLYGMVWQQGAWSVASKLSVSLSHDIQLQTPFVQMKSQVWLPFVQERRLSGGSTQDVYIAKWKGNHWFVGEQISTPVQKQIKNLSLAFGKEGTALAVWAERLAGTGYSPFYLEAAGFYQGKWQVPEKVKGCLLGESSSFELASATDGTLVLAWEQEKEPSSSQKQIYTAVWEKEWIGSNALPFKSGPSLFGFPFYQTKQKNPWALSIQNQTSSLGNFVSEPQLWLHQLQGKAGVSTKKLMLPIVDKQQLSAQEKKEEDSTTRKGKIDSWLLEGKTEQILLLSFREENATNSFFYQVNLQTPSILAKPLFPQNPVPLQVLWSESSTLMEKRITPRNFLLLVTDENRLGLVVVPIPS